MNYDLLVIGAGSGGVAAAEQAVALGAKVGIIESDKVGGTCVNAGCVPKKIMWNAATLSEYFSYFADYGFDVPKHTFNFTKLVRDRDRFIHHLNKIYLQRLKNKKVTFIKGHAKFVDAHTLKVGKKNYSAKNIIIAVGCDPAIPNIEGKEFAIESDGFFKLKKQPKNIAIIGGGYIGVELAGILNLLGVKVQILVRDDSVLSKFDPLLSASLEKHFNSCGVKIVKQAETVKIVKNKNKTLSIFCKNGKCVKSVETVLFATGRNPRTSTLHLEAVGVKLNPKDNSIITDKYDRTACKNIYAIGDVAGKKLLTPVAVAAGRLLAKRLFGKDKNIIHYENIPVVVFARPPLATVGLTEQAAQKKYGKNKIEIHQTRFYPLFQALSKNKAATCMKLITLKSNQKILGCHMIGAHVDEILQGFAVAIKMGATKKDFDNTMAIHPTSAEELVTMK